MSLTFSQTTQSLSKPLSLNDINPSAFSFGIQSMNTFGTINITNTFNNQFNDIYKNLNNIRQDYQQKVNEYLNTNPLIVDKYRNDGVSLAWKYEKVEIGMGGKGTTEWMPDKMQEILEKGKATRGPEGHHINNVADHPEMQSNPDNVKFAKSYDEHKNSPDFHNGKFQNETSGDLIDRNDRLEKTNKDRVFKNELTGIGAAVAIGLGVGFALGFVITLAQTGISTESLKNAVILGGKTGVEGAVLGVLNHLAIRGIGDMATNALQGVVENLGLTVTENITKMCNMAVFGALAIVVFSVYQFTKLKLKGYSTKECLLRVGKSAAFSVTVLLVSIVAQGLWGGYAGIIVSISIGIIVVSYKVIDNQHNKRISEKVHLYMIQKCEPIMLGV